MKRIIMIAKEKIIAIDIDKIILFTEIYFIIQGPIDPPSAAVAESMEIANPIPLFKMLLPFVVAKG